MHAFLLIDHGSRRAEANALIHEVAERVTQRLAGDAIVETAHMELAPPTIVQAFTRCVDRGATTIIVHPFMLAPGRHVSEDLPRLVAEAASRYEGVRFVMAAPLGSHEGVVDAVVSRCETALSEV